MRCPKCGFISFDHLDTCLKCNKEFKDIPGLVQGTVFKVQAPSFLKIQLEPEKKSFGDIEIDSDVADAEFELQDPDLEILLDEEGQEESLRGATPDMQISQEEDNPEISVSEDFELSLDTAKEEEVEGISIDLGQFKHDVDDNAAGFDDFFGEKKEEEKTQLDFSGELADISDLSPPHQRVAPPVSPASVGTGAIDDFNLSLDLGFDDLDKEMPAPPKEKKTAVKAATLSLDDIDLSPITKQERPAQKAAPGSMDMDEDLNFDLDLGGLSIHKD